jgi:phosphate-selective porin OprO and OprP
LRRGCARRSAGAAGAAVALGWLCLCVAPGGARAEPPPATETPAAAAPAAAGGAREETQAAAALRATQDLDARLIELRRELDASLRERAAWEDMRRRLDELDLRMQALSRELPSALPAGEVTSALPLQVHDGGFTVRSANGAFLFEPGLRIQGEYQGVLASAGPMDSAPPRTSGFVLSDAEIMLDGHAFNPRLEYRLQVDFVSMPSPVPTPVTSSPPLVKDAFVQWRLTRAVAVRIGKFKVPYGLQRLYYQGVLQFVDISAPAAAFSLDRDVGLMVVGRPLGGRLQYQLAVLNGAGQVNAIDNFDLAYAARIVAAPFGPLPTSEGDIDGQRRPLVSAGVSGYYNLVPTDIVLRSGDPQATTDLNGDGRIDNVAVWQAGVELRAVFRGASLQGEWFGRIEQPGAGASARKFWGAYGQAGFFVLPHRIEVAARVGRTDLPLYGVSRAVRLRSGSTLNEQGAALAGYLAGHHAKLQIAYDHLVAEDAGSAPRVNQLQAAAQLWF